MNKKLWGMILLISGFSTSCFGECCLSIRSLGDVGVVSLALNGSKPKPIQFDRYNSKIIWVEDNLPVIISTKKSVINFSFDMDTIIDISIVLDSKPIQHCFYISHSSTGQS